MKAPSLGLAFLLLVPACGGGDDNRNMNGNMNGTMDGGTVQTGIITGTVRSAVLNGEPAPAAGVTVKVMGTNTSVTTDAAGFFSMEAPVGITHLHAELAEHWSTIYTLDNSAGTDTDNDFEVVPNNVVASVSQAIGETIDPARGIVFFDFETANAGGGEQASVPDSSGAFTFDDQDAPSEGTNLVAGGDTFLLFHGVPTGTTTVTVMGASAVNNCTIKPAAVTAWPVQAATFTEINVICTP
jgi:hypothetical protein